MFKRRRRPQQIEDRIYHPNYGIKIITEKFYARHDNSEVLVQNIERYKYYANELDKRYKYDARDRYYAPITTNQTYGWLERLADRYTGRDRSILFRRVPRDNIMHILNQVSIDINRGMQLNKL